MAIAAKVRNPTKRGGHSGVHHNNDKQHTAGAPHASAARCIISGVNNATPDTQYQRQNTQSNRYNSKGMEVFHALLKLRG